jgi:flagellar basal-body rod protein FlgB
MTDFSISNAVGLLSGRIEYLDARHKLIIDNLANVDTPGFKSKDLSFDGYVNSALDNAASGNAEDASVASGGLSLHPKAEVFEREGHAKLDGNNVNVETEMANMTDNSVEFMTATEILKRHLGLIKYAISPQ